MPDHATFLRAILAAPDDDLPRLVYADFLDEQGDPRGEFIRVQCDLARLPERSPRQRELLARQTVLLTLRREKWLAPLVQLFGEQDKPLRHGYFFRRGFVETLHVPGIAFLDRAAAVLRLAPIQDLRLTPITIDPLYRLLREPWLGQLRSLSLMANRLGDEAARAFTATPKLAGLRSLDLESCGIGPEGIHALTCAQHWTHLRRLDLANNSIGSSALWSILRWPLVDQLERLDLRYTGADYFLRRDFQSRLGTRVLFEER